MISKITASTVYSTLGNNSSLVPLAIKDIANSCGLTAASYMSGDAVEGKDRFIDEFGTQAIWLGGLPVFNKIFEKLLYTPAKLDSKVDARILKNSEILKAAQEFAPTEAIKSSLEQVASHQKTFKMLTVAKFAAASIATTLSYLGLTKFRHKYTENQIKKDYFEKQKHKHITFKDKNPQNIPFSAAFSQVHNVNKINKNVAFTGGVENFIFDPVRNLMLVDGAITGERLSHARNPQDFFGYVIKEGSFWAFMYFAGPLISKALELNAEKKHNKSIDLDARIIESEQFKNAFKNGTIKSHLEAFKAADKSDVDIYKFAVKSANTPNQEAKNLVIEMAKKSDIIEMAKGSEKVDTRKYIDLNNLRGVAQKMEKLLNQYESSGESLDGFFASVRKLKRTAVIKNIGACIGALGVAVPAIMLLVRHFSPEYQVKIDIEKQLEESLVKNNSK